MTANIILLLSWILSKRQRYEKRREMTPRLSFNTACELGFAGASTNWSALWGQLPDAERSDRRPVRCIAWLGREKSIDVRDQRMLHFQGTIMQEGVPITILTNTEQN